MLRKFFILTRGRTGSTAIMDELHNSALISATQELFLQWEFNKNFPETKEMYDIIWPYVLWKQEYQSTKKTSLFTPNDKFLTNKYLSIAESRSRKRGSLGFGFKVLRNNLEEWPFLLRLLRKRKYRVIYLNRYTPNRVLSGMIANISGVWNTKEKGLGIGKYTIDIDEFERKVKWEDRQVELDLSLLSSVGIPCLPVAYEKYCDARRSFFEEIFSYLDIPYQMPPSSDYQIILKDLPSIIQNYNEVVNAAEAIGLPIIK